MSSPVQGYTWVDRPIARSPMSMGYRIGLAVVSVTMILLPLLYVLFCAAIAYGLYYFAVNDVFLLGLHQIGIVAYLGPIVAGLAALVCMVKPLFTRPRKIAAHLEITREQEPKLFQFIDEVCTRVGAPKPVRVQLDNQVNASASFEHGWLGVIRRRLVLTIGLPFAQGLDVSQFGGVLAHEFGHFTQSAAMSFNYVIRTTNGWFSRVIFERDGFDLQLQKWSKRGSYYSIIIANTARGCVWLARKVLWLLMRAGHAVSAYLMRQMEYDADHYEQEVAGAKNFRETFLLLRLINVGATMTGNHQGELWKKGKLVDNTPLLTRRLIAQLPENTVQQLREGLDSDKTVAPWHATHPSDPERIARSIGRDETGVLIGNQPASTLFADFDRVAEKLTVIDYKERFKLQIKPEALVPTESYLQENSARAERIKGMTDFFGGLLQDYRLVFPAGPESGDASSLADIHARYHAIAQQLEQARPDAEKLCQSIEALRTSRAQAMAAQMLIGMGIAVQAQQFSLENLEPGTITRVIEENTAKIDELNKQLEPALKLAAEKLGWYCAIPSSPEWLARVQGSPDWTKWLDRITTLKTALLAIRPIHDQLNKARKAFFLANICVENFKAAKNKKWAEREFNAFAAELQVANQQIEKIASSMPYPLNDGNSYTHLAGYFVAGNNQPGPVGQFTYLRTTYGRFSHLYVEVVTELLEKVGGVELAAAETPSH